MKILIFFAGPSAERGISLNSARSLSDHLARYPNLIIDFIFVSKKCDFYQIDSKWLYCNTAEDFEFKILQTSPVEKNNLIDLLKQYDLLVPMIHGTFGEDGTLQSFFEEHELKFFGSGSIACKKAFYKNSALDLIHELGLGAGPYLYLKDIDKLDQVEIFMTTYPSKSGYIIKPNEGGSSIGVAHFHTIDSVYEIVKNNKTIYMNGVIIEPFYQAQEFSITVIQKPDGAPQSLIPCSIHYPEGEFFDFRKKYMPSTKSTWKCPPACDESTLIKVRAEAEKLFNILGCRHAARFDGWIFNDGKISFSDINLISGMEQNSLFFMQAAVCGLSHQALCTYLMQIAMGLNPSTYEKDQTSQSQRKKVYILMGGQTAERQVSLMSGTNVWLKLRNSLEYEPVPFFIALDGKIYQPSYQHLLYHTVEEVEQAILSNHQILQYRFDPFADLELPPVNIISFTNDEFCQKAQKDNAFVFLGLHGGDGENGVWQELLESYQLPFNGSGSIGSRNGMDKLLTAQIINSIKDRKLYGLPKTILNLELYPHQDSLLPLKNIFESHQSVIIKPRSDGCSAGVIVLQDYNDLVIYYNLLKENATTIPAHTFYQQSSPVDMPTSKQDFILEAFIQTDKFVLEHGVVRCIEQTGWIELTQGVLEFNGRYEALNASLAVSNGAVLSVEEKFQGGTGTNLTPVPFLTEHQRYQLGCLIEVAARALEIKNYARLDLFYHKGSGDVIIIEVNTLPGLTPSTVLFHQGLAHEPSFEPRALLEHIIKTAWTENFINIKNLKEKVQ